jgi:hypothetical protein
MTDECLRSWHFWGSISFDEILVRLRRAWEDREMAFIIETCGDLDPVFPANGRTFGFSELIELMGTQLSIYELESTTPDRLCDRAYYIVAIRNAREKGLDRNQAASNIYAPSMKGLVDRSVYGRALVCKLAELESMAIPEAA